MSEDDRLTSPTFWDEVHDQRDQTRLYPRPRFYLLDCELERVFHRHLKSLAGQTMIEFGCGSSTWLPYFVKQHKMRIVGIDYSAQGIENARRILLRNGIAGELIQGDFLLPGAPVQARASAIFSLGLIEHFPDTRTVLAALAQYLRPGGTIISWLPHTKGRIVRWSCRLNPGLENVYKVLNLDDVADSHRQCGLQVTEAVYTQFADLTLINLSRLGRQWQKWLYRLFRLISLPLVLAGRCTGFFLRWPAWCSGMVVVARKEESSD
jgi:SAM-dependent methyltransferase